MLTRRGALETLGTGMAGLTVPANGAVAAPAAPRPAPPSARLVLEALVDVASAEALGRGPAGERRIVPILGGTFDGPRLRGKVRPGGADRQIVREDGVRQLWALYELETTDGAVITVSNRVLIDEPAGAPRYAFSQIELTAPVGPYAWLNRRVFVGTLASLRPDRQGVRVGVYELV